MQGGFERKRFSERVEQAFDQVFAYERPLTETFRYAHAMQHGTPEECAVLRAQAVLETAQQKQSQQAVAEQRDMAPTLPTPALERTVTPAVERTSPKPERSRGIGM